MSPKPLIASALQGLCPQCGATTLFAGPVRFADKCRACGLDFSRYNIGDGPAALLTLVVGALVMALAAAVELTIRPPLIVHALLWIPVTMGAVLGGLRIAKAALLIAEHRKQGGEGRVVENREP